MGTAREIYDAPNSEFVAGFVGISNLLHREGKVISIRPEKIKLGRVGDKVAPGEVASVMFLGALTRINVAIGSDVLTILAENDGSQEFPGVGEQIEVSWNSKYEFQVG